MPRKKRRAVIMTARRFQAGPSRPWNISTSVATTRHRCFGEYYREAGSVRPPHQIYVSGVDYVRAGRKKTAAPSQRRIPAAVNDSNHHRTGGGPSGALSSRMHPIPLAE